MVFCEMIKINKHSYFNNKQIGINLLSNICSYTANIVISFVLTPFLINTLGKETYSFYPIANNIITYLSVITVSMNTIASRFITVNISRNRIDEASKYFSSILLSNIVMCLIIVIPMTIIITSIDRILDIPINIVSAVRMLFILVFATALVNILTSVFGVATFAKNRIDLRSIRELITAVLRLALFFILYSFFPPSIVYVGAVALVISIINIVFQVFFTKTLLPEIKITKYNISLKYIKEIFFVSVWNIINSLGNMLLTGTILFISNYFYGSNVSGTYAIVQTVPQFLNGIIVMLVGVFYPVVMHRFAQNDMGSLLLEISKAQKVVGSLVCGVITVFIVLSKDFFSLWTPNEDSTLLSKLLLVTIVPHMFIGCLWILTNLNVAMNKVKVPAFLTVSIGLLNIIIVCAVVNTLPFNIYYIPLISTVLQVVWIGFLIPKYVSGNLNVNLKLLYLYPSKILIVSLFNFMLLNFLKPYICIKDWTGFFFWGVLLGGFCLFIYALCMGLLNKKQIREIFKN